MEAYRRHVAFLSLSRLISVTGSIAAYVALVAVIYDRSGHSGTWVALALVVSFGVSALLGPWAGQLGDRHDRRRVVIASVAGRTMRRHGDAHAERGRLLFGCGLVAVAVGLCGVVPLVGAVVLLFSVGGVAARTRGIAATLVFQRSTPDHLRARTFAALGTANTSAIGVAMVVGGLVMGTLTPAGVCVACGLVGLLALLIATRVPPRGRDRGGAGTARAEAASARGRRGWSLATGT